MYWLSVVVTQYSKKPPLIVILYLWVCRKRALMLLILSQGLTRRDTPSLWGIKGGISTHTLVDTPKSGVKMKLSASQVKSAKPLEKPYKLSDGRGMYLQVMANGAKYWRLKYRLLAGRNFCRWAFIRQSLWLKLALFVMKRKRCWDCWPRLRFQVNISLLLICPSAENFTSCHLDDKTTWTISGLLTFNVIPTSVTKKYYAWTVREDENLDLIGNPCAANTAKSAISICGDGLDQYVEIEDQLSH